MIPAKIKSEFSPLSFPKARNALKHNYLTKKCKMLPKTETGNKQNGNWDPIAGNWQPKTGNMIPENRNFKKTFHFLAFLSLNKLS